MPGLTARLLMAILVACGAAQTGAAAVKTYVSIPPLAFFVERVGGPSVSVGVLVGPGQNPHTYEPTPRQLVELSDAQVFFRVGMPFEDALIQKMQSTQPNLVIVDVRKGVALRPSEETDGKDHGGAPDPHIWLSPSNAKIIARNVAGALQRLDPAAAVTYDQNLKALLADTDRVAARISEMLAPFKGRTFYIYHPAFGYFADAFGLHEVAVEVGGKEPSARDLVRLIARAQEDHVRVIFTEMEFSRKPAESLAAELGAAVVSINPLARDYLSNLEDVAAKLRDSWKPPKP